MNQTEPKWAKLSQNEQNWAQMSQNKLNRLIGFLNSFWLNTAYFSSLLFLIFFESNWAKLSQTEPKWAKLSQNEP